jgi:hypothetical protein
MNPHDADPALSISVFYQWHAQDLPVCGNSQGFDRPALA